MLDIIHSMREVTPNPRFNKVSFPSLFSLYVFLFYLMLFSLKSNRIKTVNLDKNIILVRLLSKSHPVVSGAPMLTGAGKGDAFRLQSGSPWGTRERRERVPFDLLLFHWELGLKDFGYTLQWLQSDICYLSKKPCLAR